MIIERLENHRYEKNIKFFRWLAIASAGLALLHIGLNPQILNGDGKALDFFNLLLPIVFYFQYYKTAKNWKGQFFEWRENEIEFKSRKYPRTIISHKELLDITIKLDLIILETTKTTFEISIEDYTEYEDRIKLKSKFEELKKQLDTIMAKNNAV